MRVFLDYPRGGLGQSEDLRDTLPHDYNVEAIPRPGDVVWISADGANGGQTESEPLDLQLYVRTVSHSFPQGGRHEVTLVLSVTPPPYRG